ncbi:RidA family protein [Bradyrhizobium sp. 199]|uniref:RidA family protein n=1 Tax=Bradyrhizobium sp. 199 TaxID=2782664 RepID=UPI001FF88F21|nr:RidA family protein [Bradyrhizobium sp. 199]
MSRSIQVVAGLFESRPYGFAQVALVRTPFGDVANFSGQVAWDADRKIVGPGDIRRQLEKSLENLAVALVSVGATLNDVGALRLYIKQDHLHESEAISGALRAAFGRQYALRNVDRGSEPRQRRIPDRGGAVQRFSRAQVGCERLLRGNAAVGQSARRRQASPE